MTNWWRRVFFGNKPEHDPDFLRDIEKIQEELWEKFNQREDLVEDPNTVDPNAPVSANPPVAGEDQAVAAPPPPSADPDPTPHPAPDVPSEATPTVEDVPEESGEKTYRVVGSSTIRTPSGSHPPGKKFTDDLPAEQEAALVAMGAIEVVW